MVIFFVNNRKFALFNFKQNSWPPFNNDLERKEKLFVCFTFVTIVTTGILKILLLTCHFRFYLNASWPSFMCWLNAPALNQKTQTIQRTHFCLGVSSIFELCGCFPVRTYEKFIFLKGKFFLKNICCVPTNTTLFPVIFVYCFVIKNFMFRYEGSLKLIGKVKLVHKRENR